MANATTGSKYASKITREDFKSRLMSCTFDMCVQAVSTYGTVNDLHVYVHPHAGRNLKYRGSSNCFQLLVEWFKDAIAEVQILEDILMADDEFCDKFMVLDRDWGRVLTFSVLPSSKEYIVLLQSVFFLTEAKNGIFYVGTPDAFCYSVSRHGSVVSGVENIPEMELQKQEHPLT